jgi:hypothetical protein
MPQPRRRRPSKARASKSNTFQGATFMNSISNIWQHPKTTAVGLLIAATTVAGVLSQQGITLGHAGTGTVVTLAGALASAFLGLLARDPGAASSSGGATGKLGAWALIALLLPLPFISGCSGSNVAQDIVNWAPALQSAVATVDSTAALLAPSDAPIFSAATVGFDAASNLLVAQSKAYLADPSASALAQMQTQVVTLQQQVNAALLQAAKIVNPASQQHALAAIQAVATIVNTILSLVQSISSKAAVAQMVAASTIKLAAVAPYMNKCMAAAMVAQHYGESVSLAAAQVDQTENIELQNGL